MKHSFLKFIEVIHQFNHRLSRLCEAIGVMAILLIMVVTFLDVIGSKTCLHPIPGSIDIIMQVQTVAIAFCAASALIAGVHVRVEFFLMKMPPVIRSRIGLVIDMSSLILFLVIGWRLAIYGYQVYQENEVTPTAHIPLYPFAFGITLAMIPVCIELGIKMVKRSFGETVQA